VPNRCRTVIDGNGRELAIACSRGERHRCSTPGCQNDGTKQCDFPVKRNGKPGTCDRYICQKCAMRVGPDLDYCGPHARQAKASP
jgi:hypothetical protein